MQLGTLHNVDRSVVIQEPGNERSIGRALGIDTAESLTPVLGLEPIVRATKLTMIQGHSLALLAGDEFKSFRYETFYTIPVQPPSYGAPSHVLMATLSDAT